MSVNTKLLQTRSRKCFKDLEQSVCSSTWCRGVKRETFTFNYNKKNKPRNPDNSVRQSRHAEVRPP